MAAHHSIRRRLRARDAALRALALSAASNIPGVDFASITLHGDDQSLQTFGSTDPLAERIDALQYELREGPCYSAVTDERLVVINDVDATARYPQYGAQAAGLGVHSHAAVQLVHRDERAGLNLYSRRAHAFDSSTVLLAELFATQLAALLDYAEQVEQLSEALHTRTDIGTAVGVLMERYRIDRSQAFAYLVRHSNQRNIKIRKLARGVVAGTFQGAAPEDTKRTR